jgi:hypothetical protein
MKKILLCDIDGTICEDIPNEEVERMPYANPFEDALKRLNKWYDNGDEIHFFTSRTEDMRQLTEKWLHENGFKYNSLIMNKPRIKDGETYMWIDNKPVKAITQKGRWTELIRKEIKADIFAEDSDFDYDNFETD